MHLRVLALDLGDGPLPERECLRVGVVDAEDHHSLGDPVVEHALEFRPQPLPIVRLEVERIDVLVLLGWVLRVLHAAVGAPAEPGRVRLDVGMVRRALERNVQGDLEVVGGSCRHQLAEVLQRAELGQDVLVPALGGADGPGAADIARLGGERVVLSLALLATDRVDRRKVKHVESHACDRRQALLDVLEGAVHARLAAGRAWKQFVPAAEARAFAIRDQRQVDPEAGLQVPVRVSRRGGAQRLVERQRLEFVGAHLAGSGLALQRQGPMRQRVAILTAGALGRRRDLKGANPCRQPDIVRIDAAHQFMVPGLKSVDPGEDGVAVAPEGRRREAGVPFVVPFQLHRHLVVLRVALAPPGQHDAQRLVAFGETVRRDGHGFAGDPLDGKPSVIDARQYRVDDSAGAAVGGVDGFRRTCCGRVRGLAPGRCALLGGGRRGARRLRRHRQGGRCDWVGSGGLVLRHGHRA